MTTYQDCSIGYKKESAYGAKVTVDRWQEAVDFEVKDGKSVVQSSALRVGARVDRLNRRAITTWDPSGSLETECVSKGQGTLWEWLMGAGASTLVSAGVYQQVFTLADTLPSMSVQAVVPTLTGETIMDVTGAVCSDWELGFEQGAILSLKASYNAKKAVTAGSKTTAAYVAAPGLFTFVGAAIHTGTLTAPTTTTMASGTTPIANVRGGSLKLDHALTTDTFNMGGAGLKSHAPTPGTRKIDGTLKVESEGTTLLDAMLADTPLVLVLTWTAGALATGLETLQVAIPAIVLEGDLPKPNGGDLVTIDMPFTVLQKEGAAQPIWICTRTADAAL